MKFVYLVNECHYVIAPSMAQALEAFRVGIDRRMERIGTREEDRDGYREVVKIECVREILAESPSKE